MFSAVKTQDGYVNAFLTTQVPRTSEAGEFRSSAGVGGVLAPTPVPFDTVVVPSAGLTLDTTSVPGVPFVEVINAGKYVVSVSAQLSTDNNQRKTSSIEAFVADAGSSVFNGQGAPRNGYHRSVAVGLNSAAAVYLLDLASGQRVAASVQSVEGPGTLTLLAEAQLTIFEVGR